MHFTLTQMRHYRRQYLAVSIAIIIGVAFVLVSMQTSAVLNQTTRDAFSAEFRGADVVGIPLYGTLPDTADDAAARTEGVATVDARRTAYGTAFTAGRTSYLALATMPVSSTVLDELVLIEGRLPQADTEVVLTADVVDALGIDLGQTFETEIFGNDEAPVPASLTVVGTLPGRSGLVYGTAPDGYITDATMAAIAPDADISALLVTLDPRADTDHVVSSLMNRVTDANIMTLSQYEASQIGEATDGTDVLGMMLLAFAVVALFVAGVVIANTFSILIAQRMRTLALMRCVGATSDQVRRSVLLEAAIVGVVASLAGVMIGALVATIGVRVLDATLGSGQIATDVPIGSAAIIWPIVLGVVVTLGAAFLPSVAATRVTPLTALRPTIPLETTLRSHTARIVVAVAAIGIGGFLLTAGMLLGSQSSGVMPLMIGMVGGMISFVGVLVGAIVIVPGVARGIGRMLTGAGGAPARVATSNTVRNPGRATATAMALMIAVALITMMSVGAESSKATLTRELDARNPIDLRIAAVDFYSSPGGGEPVLPPSVIQAVTSDPDVIETTTAQRSSVMIGDIGYTVLAIDPAEALATTRIPEQLDGLADGIALIPTWVAEGSNLVSGDSVDLTMDGGGGTGTFTVVVADSREWDNDILITRSDAARSFPTMPTLEIWAKFRSGTDHLDAVNRIQDSIGGGDRFYVSGGAQDKAANERVLDSMLAIVTGLLGIAVIIALVGVGNTLSLSVIERTRETAVLRALGLTIPQFRIMLAMEGVMLAVVGALIGVVLGIGYGFAGAFTVFAGTWGLVFRLPLERIGLILLIAIVAGLVASLLPAQTATRTSPVAALAE